MILSVAMNTTKRAAFAVLWIASFVVLLGLAEGKDERLFGRHVLEHTVVQSISVLNFVFSPRSLELNVLRPSHFIASVRTAVLSR